MIGDACGDVYNPYHEWEVMFPPVPKPKVEEQRIPQAGAPSFKVLHLSDTHYDPYYLEGSNADCAEPLCCRLTNGQAGSKEQAAGKYVFACKLGCEYNNNAHFTIDTFRGNTVY